MTTTASIYARLSQDKRKGTDEEGLSVEQQVKACTEWIERKGWTVGTVYKDNNFSATSGAVRPQFERMLKDAPEKVVFWKQDRLERGHNGDLDRFLLSGIDGYGVDGSRVTIESASSEFMTRIQSLMGAHEQRIKSERIRLANERIASSGKYRGSIRPFGQNRDGSWVDGEAEAVVEAAEKIISGEWSFFKTSEVWNLRGLKTPQTGKQGGREWTSGTVRNFFTRPRLYGMQEYKGSLYELKDWKPLLTKDQFETIQLKIAAKKTGKRESTVTRHDVRLLTGIIRCADCDRGMNAAQRGGAGSTRNYRCPSTKHVTIVAEPLEEAISNHALHILAQHEEVRTQQAQTTRRLTEVQTEKLNLNKEHEEWLAEAIEAGLRPSVIAAKEAKHEESISALDEELLTLQRDKTVSIFEGANLDGWKEAPMELRRDLLNTIYSKIVISRGGQGKRFSPDVIEYVYTPLGDRLRDEYLKNELEALHPWERL